MKNNNSIIVDVLEYFETNNLIIELYIKLRLLLCIITIKHKHKRKLKQNKL